MNATSNPETWQVDAGGNIYETDFDGLTQWIYEGSLLPQDMVKRGNLRWIEARRVPALIQVFNAHEKGLPAPVLTRGGGDAQPAVRHEAQTLNFVPGDRGAPSAGISPPDPVFQNFQPGSDLPSDPGIAVPALGSTPEFCSIHTDARARYTCGSCLSPFCKACPTTQNPGEKICPFCGAMCGPVAVVLPAFPAYELAPETEKKRFGFDDFSNAVGYPFKFKSSLFFGAVLFAVFSVGGQASSMGGLHLIAGSIFCWMLANMLTFGVLSNTADNFAQGRIDVDFMPAFDDFSIWDDIVCPFFLSIAVYLVSFGLLIAVIVGGIWLAVGAITSEIDLEGSPNQARIVTDGNSPIRNMPASRSQKDLYGDGEMPSGEDLAGMPQQAAQQEEEEFRRLNDLIIETRKQQLESAIGKTKETRENESAEMLKRLLAMAFPILILGAIGLFWGLFYLPAACCVAGYTRSFTATLNPLVGLEMIKLLGWDYIKLWLMGAALVVASTFAGGVLAGIFAPFDLPGMGNLAAIGTGALFTFYLSVVFSVTVGLMLYKNSERLRLFRS